MRKSCFKYPPSKFLQGINLQKNIFSRNKFSKVDEEIKSLRERIKTLKGYKKNRNRGILEQYFPYDDILSIARKSFAISISWTIVLMLPYAIEKRYNESLITNQNERSR